MKIQSNKYKERDILIEGKKVSFNKLGEAEVSKELGEIINTNYNEVINLPIKKISKEPVSDDQLKKDNADLVAENESLTKRLDTATEDIEAHKVDIENWKSEYEKAAGEQNVSSKVSKQDVALTLELSKKTKDDLEAMATELKLPEDEWSDLLKEDLIIYLAYTAINASS